MKKQKLSRITVYHIKGGVGKTRIALNLAMSLDAAIVTNDAYSVVRTVMSANRYKILGENEILPQYSLEMPLIFDLGGHADNRAIEVLQQSQFVIMPILTYKEDFQTCLDFIEETKEYNDNIIIVINKTKPGEFEKIEKICRNFHPELAVFEIKKSKVMSHLVDQKMSIEQIAAKNKLQRRHYEKVAHQFRDILNHMFVNYRPVNDILEV